jgi:hypothetical protein
MAFFTGDQVTLLSAGTVYVAFLVEFQFQSETVRIWNGNTPLVTGGHTWLPTYGSGTIDGLGMSGGTSAESVTFTLNALPGQDPDILSLALSETPDVVQQLVIVYMQFLDSDYQIVGSPFGMFWGVMQPPKVSRTTADDTTGAIQSISLMAENAFFNRSKPARGRYTDRDQQKRSPGDKFFQFTPNLLFKRIVWPDFVILAALGLSSMLALSGVNGLG